MGCFLGLNFIFIKMKMPQAISGTRAATYKLMEPYCFVHFRIISFGKHGKGA